MWNHITRNICARFWWKWVKAIKHTPLSLTSCSSSKLNLNCSANRTWCIKSLHIYYIRWCLIISHSFSIACREDTRSLLKLLKNTVTCLIKIGIATTPITGTSTKHLGFLIRSPSCPWLICRLVKDICHWGWGLHFF
jgi:hypothetical protein